MVKGLVKAVRSNDDRMVLMEFNSVENANQFYTEFVMDYLYPFFDADVAKSFPLGKTQMFFSDGDEKGIIYTPNKFFYFVRDFVIQQN